MQISFSLHMDDPVSTISILAIKLFFTKQRKKILLLSRMVLQVSKLYQAKQNHPFLMDQLEEL